MVLREIKHLYEKYKKTGKFSVIQNQNLAKLSKNAYMVSFPEGIFDDESLLFYKHPMINLYKLWYNTNSVLGSIIHIELPIFLITLNGTFKQKFDSILNNVIFKELKKYQYTSKIGGVGCLDLLYNGPVEDIKYFIIFDKQWDKIAIDIYSTLIIGDTSSQSGKNIDQIIYDLVFEGYFLEEKKKNILIFIRSYFQMTVFTFLFIFQNCIKKSIITPSVSVHYQIFMHNM